MGLLRRFLERHRTSRRKPEGEAGIRTLGHRKYVGGNWEQMGRLQYEFLVGHGLRPEHVFVDVACGSLRAGVHLIPFLHAGHYLGIEKEAELVRLGLDDELDPDVRREKQPVIVVSDAFDFERLVAEAGGRRPDVGIAQSLFSHLPPSLIRLCLGNLRAVMAPGGVFWATFFETDRPVEHDDVPHDHGDFHYTRAEMAAYGEETGWSAEYVGDWGHPRGQHMIAYHAAPDA
jgi:hypothetical protein